MRDGLTWGGCGENFVGLLVITGSDMEETTEGVGVNAWNPVDDWRTGRSWKPGDATEHVRRASIDQSYPPRGGTYKLMGASESLRT